MGFQCIPRGGADRSGNQSLGVTDLRAQAVFIELRQQLIADAFARTGDLRQRYGKSGRRYCRAKWEANRVRHHGVDDMSSWSARLREGSVRTSFSGALWAMVAFLFYVCFPLTLQPKTPGEAKEQPFHWFDSDGSLADVAGLVWIDVESWQLRLKELALQ